jgi:hypothetical protein
MFYLFNLGAFLLRNLYFAKKISRTKAEKIVFKNQMSMGKTNNDNHRHKLKEEENNSNDQFWVEGDSKN